MIPAEIKKIESEFKQLQQRLLLEQPGIAAEAQKLWDRWAEMLAQLPAVPRAADSVQVSEQGAAMLLLLGELSLLLEKRGVQKLAEAFEDLCFPLALWLVNAAAELRELQGVVNALARLANSVSDERVLAGLSASIGALIQKVTATVSHDMDNADPNRPWRLLLLNRAIIATRSHDPALMKAAFDALVSHLPLDAPSFFSEGMQQMVALNYPERVRKVMNHYHQLFSQQQRLH
ncbi:MAG: hypothetical protein Q9N68_02035 [Gammaproteobacteria bacterium]|nr:hypothetical protein [Gammaproteobacteria bacterium]